MMIIYSSILSFIIISSPSSCLSLYSRKFTIKESFKKINYLFSNNIKYHKSVLNNSNNNNNNNNINSQRENDGIKILYDDKYIMLLWKSSNVGVLSTEQVYHAAGPSIQTFLLQDKYKIWNSLYKTKNIYSKLDKRFSGVILVGKDNKVVNIIKQYPTEYTYSAVVIGSAIDQTYNHSSSLALTISNLQTVRSGSNMSNYLSLINIKPIVNNNNDSFYSPSFLMDLLSDIGIPVLKENSFIYLSLTKLNNNFLFESNIIENDSAYLSAQDNLIPKKFLKLLKREKLLYQRKQGLMNNNNNNNNERNNIMFRNINFSVSYDSLRPRVSSGIIVETAVKYIIEKLKANYKIITTSNNSNNWSDETIKILDLGTGPGTLLLSIIKEILEYCLLNSILFPKIEATGIDINTDALGDAKVNEENLRKIVFNENININWIQCDYTKLKQLYTLSNNITICNHYNVIVCNPPYLSEESVQGRVTVENKDCLVSGSTGLEDYKDISKMISESDLLLDKNGVVIFQTPGGEKGLSSVQSVVEVEGFVTIENPPDQRGIYRCLVLKKV